MGKSIFRPHPTFTEHNGSGVNGLDGFALCLSRFIAAMALHLFDLFLGKTKCISFCFYLFAEKRRNDNKATYITNNCDDSHRTELSEFPICPQVSLIMLKTFFLFLILEKKR